MVELAFVELLFDTREVGFNNPSWTWSELEAALSGKPGRDGRAPAARRGTPAATGRRGAGAASRSRSRWRRAPGRRPYAELHCHSNFSFLDGASHPEELATEAARLGLEALAITDHDGFYGVVRFAEAARAVGMPTVFGTEITLTPGLAADQQMVLSEERHVSGRHRPGPRQPRPRPGTAITSCCSPTALPATAAWPAR